MELKNKVAVITGASSGIGDSAARELADASMKLVLTARRKELLDKITAQLDTEVAIVASDITDGPRRVARSHHRGGCNAAFMDGGSAWVQAEKMTDHILEPK